ncbi:hypothetical protein GCM10027174_31310 [Salinifilum aidingensis]
MAEFDRMPMSQRVLFVRLLQREHGGQFEPDFERWAAIAGVMSAARDRGLGEHGTWMSVANSGLLEAVERAVAAARDGEDTGPRPGTADNPGIRRWENYLVDLANGRLTARPVHDEAWSRAEQVSLDHGDHVARSDYQIRPTSAEERFKRFTDLYRWAMQNEDELPEALGTLAPVLWWFTDVRNERSYRLSAEIAMTASFGPPGLDSLTDLLARIQRECPDCVRPAPA